MVSFRDEESQPRPRWLHDREGWRQVRGDEHGMEGSEGSQGTLSGTNGSCTRLPRTRNSGRFETQSYRVRKEQQVREAQDLERFDQRPHAGDQREARIQTRGRLDNSREEPGIDHNEIEAPRSNPQRLTPPDRIRSRKEGSTGNRAQPRSLLSSLQKRNRTLTRCSC